MWPRVLVCAREMAAPLIVWHGAGSAFCQKPSSAPPTGMMAHLTNASLTKRSRGGTASGRRGTGAEPAASASAQLLHSKHMSSDTALMLCSGQAALSTVHLCIMRHLAHDAAARSRTSAVTPRGGLGGEQEATGDGSKIAQSKPSRDKRE